ncbi:Hypothetical protein R9X50_00548600 [Acrodontium crateriforme]|uniref:Phosphatidic acid phosphatase type 2/haloperoxidase domain-containing protein n=1 Tax=Acrodontium crateriforme TaxID=150365 RepID=A0AAQ3M9P8_9PEZI|nr:Hypothetical protein R9X50_00548600 [Acrodontium crateriforme]
MHSTFWPRSESRRGTSAVSALSDQAEHATTSLLPNTTNIHVISLLFLQAMVTSRVSSPSGFTNALQRFWRTTHAGDYLGLTLLLAADIVLHLGATEPFHRLFRLNDPRIQHPHAEIERVSVFYLMIYAAVVPLLFLTVWTLIIRPDRRKAHAVLLGVSISIILASVLTDIFKDAIGRPRPDLIDRCQPKHDTSRDTLVSVVVCTETRHHVLHDGWRSFPSGHSSVSFAGLGWVALFIASQTHALRPQASLAVVLLSLAPLVGAAMIAISRLEDYRHDVFDVIAGSLLGFSVTYFNWRRYFPNLRAENCEEPYSLPSSGRNSPNGGFRRVRDEEEGLTTELRRMSGDGNER